MSYQQMSFIDDQELRGGNSLAFQGASLASRIRLQDCVRLLVMNVISGQSTGESLAKLDQNGLWLKMYGDYCQANLDGSFEEYSEILPTWGMMLDGVVTELPMSEQFTPENELQLLPTLVASDYNGSAKSRYVGSTAKNQIGIYAMLRNGVDDPIYLNPSYCEIIMGFPDRWTELKA